MLLETDGNVFISQLMVTGQKDVTARAIVDTGAENTFVAEEICLQSGLTPEGSRGVTCIHGKREDLAVFRGTLKLAGKEITTTIVALPTNPVVPGGKVHAVLGRDALRSFVLHIDWPGKKGSLE